MALSPAIAANVQRNTAFDSSLATTINMAAARPDWPIVVRSYDPWDFEIIQSLGLWSVAKGVKNRLYLVNAIDAALPHTASERGAWIRRYRAIARLAGGQVRCCPLVDMRTSEPAACFVIALQEPGAFATERQVRGGQLSGPPLHRAAGAHLLEQRFTDRSVA